jgi:outer membrane protein OmpA-like peptidoglycan-associated protein
VPDGRQRVIAGLGDRRKVERSPLEPLYDSQVGWRFPVLVAAAVALAGCGGVPPAPGATRGNSVPRDASAGGRRDAGLATADCVLDAIYFDASDAKVRSIEQPIIDLYITALDEAPDIELLGIRGHRDPLEAASWSLDRAVAVRDVLVARGIAPARLQLIDRGALDPWPSPGTSARVDFEIVRQRVAPDLADGMSCTPFGIVYSKTTARTPRLADARLR